MRLVFYIQRYKKENITTVGHPVSRESPYVVQMYKVCLSVDHSLCLDSNSSRERLFETLTQLLSKN